MFETFNVAGLFIGASPVLALYGSSEDQVGSGSQVEGAVGHSL